MDDTPAHVDGNAAGGPLAELFRLDVTAATLDCRSCGRHGMLATLVVFQPDGMGTVLRCPDCDGVVLRLAHHAGHYWLDVAGTTRLRVPDG